MGAKYREILVLFYLEELDYNEISEVLHGRPNVKVIALEMGLWAQI